MNRKRRRGGSAWIAILVLIAVAAIVLFGVFRIRKVKISGNTTHAANEIQQDLIYDFKTQNTLYFAWLHRDGSSDEHTPYLQSVTAKILSPGTVQVVVSEKPLVGCVQYNKRYISFDGDGVVMNMAEERPEGLPIISGMTMDEPELYQKLPADNAQIMSAMLSIAHLVGDSDLNVDGIAFDENLNISLTIGTITVELGQNEYLEEKIANLGSIYDKIDGRTGTLNMTAFTGSSEKVTFIEEGAEEVTEAETDADGENTGLNSSEPFQAFDSNGNLYNGATVVNGQVVDASGNVILGAYIDENGDVYDGYMNLVSHVTIVQSRTSEDTGSSNLTVQTAEDAVQSGSQGAAAETNVQPETQETTAETTAETSGETVGLSAFQAFSSDGTLHNDAHVVGGQVVDAYGNVIPGCYVNADGNVVDGYMNVISPLTGTLAQ